MVQQKNDLIRLGNWGVAAVYEAGLDEYVAAELDGIYEELGLRHATWIMEVDDGRRRIVVFPSNVLQVEAPAPQQVFPPFF